MREGVRERGDIAGGGRESRAYPGPTSWFFGFLTENCGVLADIYPVLNHSQKWFRTLTRNIRYVRCFCKCGALRQKAAGFLAYFSQALDSDRRHRQEQEDVSIVLWRDRQTDSIIGLTSCPPLSLCRGSCERKHKDTRMENKCIGHDNVC